MAQYCSGCFPSLGWAQSLLLQLEHYWAAEEMTASTRLLSLQDRDKHLKSSFVLICSTLKFLLRLFFLQIYHEGIDPHGMFVSDSSLAANFGSDEGMKPNHTTRISYLLPAGLPNPQRRS